jgi:serine/threonine-protein kinase RsbW
VSSEGGPRAEAAGRRGPAATSGPAELTRLVGEVWAGVEVDLTLAPLICIGILGRPGQLVEVRHQLERWAAGTGLSAVVVADLVLASYEALANAAEHAYPIGAGSVDLVAARTTDGRVLVTVRDHGTWRRPPLDPGLRGRGLLMIQALTQRVEVRQGQDGTTVHMEWELPATQMWVRDAAP